MVPSPVIPYLLGMVFTIDDPLGILGLLFTESTVYKVLFQSETLLTL